MATDDEDAAAQVMDIVETAKVGSQLTDSLITCNHRLTPHPVIIGC